MTEKQVISVMAAILHAAWTTEEEDPDTSLAVKRAIHIWTQVRETNIFNPDNREDEP